MRFSALFFFGLYGCSWASNYFCVHQPRTVFVKEGESATIPCTYTFSETLKNSPIRVNWWETDGPYCHRTNQTIIDVSGNVIDKYRGRLSRVKDLRKNQTESIRIQGLQLSDGRMFCCSVTLSTNGKDTYIWQDVFGTVLNFADKKFVFQFDDLIAVMGENITIPCYYPLEMTGAANQVIWETQCNSCMNISKVTTSPWKKITTENNIQFSLVDFPTDVSLRIHNVSSKGSSYYRCVVSTNNGWVAGRQGTELTIADSSSSSSFTVTQSYNITGHRGESVTLSCSYSPYMESDVLGVDIYWRAGNINGPYVYHPYKEMVHPNYRGRTGIIRGTDLHIQGLEMSDASMYYCFVMIRKCTANDVYANIVKYGEGTRLRVADHIGNELQPHPQVVIMATYITMKFLIFLTIWILILLYCK
ncbi:uncharacterized protein [Engystomops pustulosus]|uniref:uncharacterized protein n=1 Tax=Engystomops pustulosus TaxID=76066 RepID=UPI003AFB7C52